MSNRKLKIDPGPLHRIVSKLIEIEKSNTDLQLHGIPISELLVTISDINTSKSSVSVRVKFAILKTYGVKKPDPSTVPDETAMSDFNFNDMQSMKLTERFNAIAKQSNPNTDIVLGDVQNCEKVKDCIDLVASATI
jgi:hypothetical protein